MHNNKKPITSEIVAAYSQCVLRAYNLLCLGKIGITHEYVSILEKDKIKNREEYLGSLTNKMPGARPYSIEELRMETPVLIGANLDFEDLKVFADIITREENALSKNNHHYVYIPTHITGTHNISKEQKIYLGFIGYVLSKTQKTEVTFGVLIGNKNTHHRIKLSIIYKEIESILKELRKWIACQSPDLPPIILNKYCTLCSFQKECEEKAKESDNLSLLNKLSTLKQLKKYERKGIFTVNQLSYLYRPRRQRKRSRSLPSAQHSLELQALVLRVGKIYLHTIPEIPRNQTELFLDIEGIPDRQSFYLIGLLVCENDNSNYHFFWADDSTSDELKAWLCLVEFFRKYKDCPVYHYGNYDAQAIAILGRRYKTETEEILKRLVNVNNSIYGKVYFPIRSNSLKEIGKFIGASWTSPDASGLESLVWRHHWESTQQSEYKQKLLTYNYEDCVALKQLVDFLSVIKEKDDSLLDIDCFVQSKKSRNSKVKNPLHHQLELMLKFAHADYANTKICFREKDNNSEGLRKEPVRTVPLRKYRRVTRTIHVPEVSKCQKCGYENLHTSKRKCERIKVNLVFSRNGARKSVIKYWAHYVFCVECKKYSKPVEFSVKGRPEIYGDEFKKYIAYQRVALRLPYRSIIMSVEDMFNETIAVNTITDYLQKVARDYIETEDLLIKKLLSSPFLHVDETPVNIDHINQYVWGFTDGQHVVFKHTKTRDASFVHEFLADYKGILISDFSPGYDSLNCKHQKCLVHVVRDLNNDLWSNPFDVELGRFVSEVRDLLVPIMEVIQKYGLKTEILSSFKMAVEEFYVNTIIDHSYKSELCSKYQERFIKYRGSLFTFLDHDGISWHNNPIENALRAITLQLDVSKVLHDPVVKEFLILLGVKQTCKVQKKSFLKFLLSKEKDIDIFIDYMCRKPKVSSLQKSAAKAARPVAKIVGEPIPAKVPARHSVMDKPMPAKEPKRRSIIGAELEKKVPPHLNVDEQNFVDFRYFRHILTKR
ncbi:MAG: TM0106 family RecB-like putative nuclease, partial [Magnetococcales bacterium]|nr:TM0106 family RecB-like putative nuclease [Magnetococcales bacterium]